MLSSFIDSALWKVDERGKQSANSANLTESQPLILGSLVKAGADDNSHGQSVAAACCPG